jgi:uncharacterized membrane protein
MALRTDGNQRYSWMKNRLMFVFWVAVAQAIYIANFGYEAAASIPDFVRQVFTTPAGWTLIIVVN